MRIVIIESEEMSGHLQFDSSEMTDSEALHQLLCLIDPGETYSVRFYNK